MSALTAFHLFTQLPLELQMAVWRLAFVHHTSYSNTAWEEHMMQHLGHPISAPLVHVKPSGRIEAPAFWKVARINDIRTTQDATSRLRAKSRHSFVRFVVDPCSLQINTLSGIPELLRTCRLSRQVALEVWLESFLGRIKTEIKFNDGLWSDSAERPEEVAEIVGTAVERMKKGKDANAWKEIVILGAAPTPPNPRKRKRA